MYISLYDLIYDQITCYIYVCVCWAAPLNFSINQVNESEESLQSCKTATFAVRGDAQTLHSEQELIPLVTLLTQYCQIILLNMIEKFWVKQLRQIDKFFIATKTNTSIVYVTTIKKAYRLLQQLGARQRRLYSISLVPFHINQKGNVLTSSPYTHDGLE